MRIRTRDGGRCPVVGGHTYVSRQLLVGDEVASQLLVFDYLMRIGATPVRLGGIGAVSTARQFRMKGYMRALMEDTVEYMKNEGYDLSAVTGMPPADFYNRFGYAPCLPDCRMVVSALDAEEAREEAGTYHVRNIEASDMEVVLQLYNWDNRTRTGSIVRTGEDFARFPRGTVYGERPDHFLIQDEQSQLLGYAVYDKPNQSAGRLSYADQIDVVEVAGRDDRSFSAILCEFARMAVQRRCDRITFFLPPDHPFALFCRKYGCDVTARYYRNGGSMFRIVDQDGLLAKLTVDLRDRVRRAGIGGAVSLRIKSGVGATTLCLGEAPDSASAAGEQCSLELSQGKLTQLIMGYRSVRDILNDSGVRAEGNVEPLADALFHGCAPYNWMPDWF